MCIHKGVTGDIVTKAREGLRRLQNNSRLQYEEARSGDQVTWGGRNASGETVARAREGLRRLQNNNRLQYDEARSGDQVTWGGRNNQGADESQDADVIRLAASR